MKHSYTKFRRNDPKFIIEGIISRTGGKKPFSLFGVFIKKKASDYDFTNRRRKNVSTR